MNDSQDRLVYHSEQRRHVRGGCMPVFVLISLAFFAGLFTLVRVEMKPPLRPAGEGNLLYRKDELLETQIRQRSPLPLRLPRYVAPLRLDEGVVNLPLRRRLSATDAPEELPFPSAADSVVLNSTDLLELPPAKEAEETPAPSQETSPTAQPPASEPAPASPLFMEPASAGLPGKEVA